jgi:hypothetical protein
MDVLEEIPLLEQNFINYIVYLMFSLIVATCRPRRLPAKFMLRQRRSLSPGIGICDLILAPMP